MKLQKLIEIQEKIDLLQSQDLEVQAGTLRADAKQLDNELTSAKNRESTEAQKNLLVRLKIRTNAASNIPPATEDLTCGNPITTLFI